MKKFTLLGLIVGLFLDTAEAGGIWTPLASGPPVGVNNCLLLSDGTVLGMNGAGQCTKLTPDIHGSYVNGTWTSLATMNDGRLFCSSIVLTNGNIYVAGGEYGNADGYAELYNPQANTWSIIQSGFFCSDACAMLLPNGNVLQSDSQSSYWIYNTAANAINYVGSCQDMNETCWVRLPSDNVLAVTGYSVTSEHYVPSLNGWYADNNLPVPVFGYGAELGAAFTLPNGNVFQIGGTTNTAIYTPGSSLSGAGSWVAGPGMPNNLGAVDAPAAMLANGNVLMEIGPVTGFNGPCYFYEYNYLSNNFTQVAAPGGGSTFGSVPYANSMLCLPDGSVLLVGGQNSGSLYVYTPTNNVPLAAGQPLVSSIVENMDGSYHLTGTNLAGISRGAAYGDDEQMDSNYPLVRMTNMVSGNVYYARTYGWNSTTIQSTNTMTTEFVLPQNLPAGTYSLVAVAVGNPSAPMAYTYSPPIAPTGLSAVSGSNTFVNLSWNGSIGATAYNVKRSLTSSGYYTTIATLVGTNYTDTGLTNGITYYYKVAAVGGGGPSSDSTSVSAAPFGPPPVPAVLTAMPDTFERVDLLWNASYGATNYNLKRSTIHNGPYTNIASLPNLSYVDSGLVSGVTYYYVVSAVSGGGESSNSVEASVTAQAVSNFGFETPSLGSGYQYAIPGAGWTFNGIPGGGSGILVNGSGFSNPNAPQGVQAAFLQSYGVISQVLSGFNPGTTYTITYSAAQRTGNSESWNVLIDSMVIRSNSPGGTSYATYTATFVATSMTHTLFFVGTDLAGGDNTVFLDNVRISPALSTTVALPVLTQNTLPATAVNVVGDSVTFTAAFGNLPVVNYQWQFISNGGAIVNIPGGTNSTLMLNNLQLTNNGFYRLEAINATNKQGVIFSGPSPLTVNPAPAIVSGVMTAYAAQTGYGSAGTNFVPTWAVAAGSLIAGQTPSSVGTGNFSMNGTGGTNVLTDGSFGYLNYWPGIGSSPTEVTCGSSAGQSVTYTLAGSAGGYLLTNITVYGGWGDAGRDQQAYTVYYSTVAAPSTFIQLGAANYNPPNAAAVQSATRATFSPGASGWAATNVAAVKFDFTAPAGENGYSGYSEISLYGMPLNPVVVANTLPVTAADVVGSQITFTAVINGINLGYQWQKISGGVTNTIPGATNASLTLVNLQLTNSAAYQLVASNIYGVAASAPGTLTVSSVPSAVNNVITTIAAQTGFGSGTFTPTWTVTTNISLIAGQSPSGSSGNFSLEIAGRSPATLTAGDNGSLTKVSGASGSTTSTNYVTCGNGGGAGASLIYSLAGAANGFSLTNIMVYGGWADAGRDQQAYTVYYSKVAAPAVFYLLGSVNYNPADSANAQSATRVTLTPANGLLATNVAAVKFDFTTPASENGYVGYSPIVLAGKPTAVPLATNPTNITYQVAGNVLNLSWPGDHIGWQLQVQTNSLAQGLGTNWFNIAGSSATNQVAIPINVVDGCVFYRLTYQ